MSPEQKKCILVILALALLAAALTGCGSGRASNQEKISKSTGIYLRELADGDVAKACEQLTRRAKGDECEAMLEERRPRLESEALKNAADGSIDIDVDGEMATAGLSEPE